MDSRQILTKTRQSHKCDLNIDAWNHKISLPELIITSKVTTKWHGKKQFVEPRAAEFNKTHEGWFDNWQSNHGSTYTAMSHEAAVLCLGILNSTTERAGTTTPAVVAAAIVAVAQCCLHATIATTTY